IDIELVDPKRNDKSYRITTTLEKVLYKNGRIEKDYYERLTQKTKPDYRKFPWGRIFVCAYGAGRGTSGTGDIAGYSVINAVYNMFNYTEGLQNPELSLHRIASKSKNLKEKALNSISKIMLGHISNDKNFSVFLDETGIVVNGPWGKIPLRDIADGYKSTCLWLTDLIGWAWTFDKRLKNINKIKGILLIDEIEQHLHPKWQKSIIGDLKNEFPNLQIIATTHSPLTAIGTTELRDEECSIVVLQRIKNFIDFTVTSPPRRKRVDQVLTSWLFDLLITSDNAIKRDIEQYSKLYSKDKRSVKEEEVLNNLNEILSQELGSGETELERKVTDMLDRIFEEMYNKKLKKIKGKKSPSSYEILRQLKSLID
ncbi:MAG: AAA family ATPase, partial [Nitrosopumilus sp.]